jgi:hypothetical protein
MAACIVAAAVPAHAGQESVPAPNPLVIIGSDWMRASVDMRLAFISGVTNLIMAEGAYAKANNLQMPPVSAAIVKQTEQQRPIDIEAEITNWFRANPDKQSLPVMAMYWKHIIKR